MSDLMEYRSDMTVELIDHMGNDDSILRAMLASTHKASEIATYDDETKRGKINFLMKNRHGTPFEHAAMQWYEEMPIFVFREYHRHRIGWSYNEMSGRYVELPPTFYVPDRDRDLIQSGKPGHYTYGPGDQDQFDEMQWAMQQSNRNAYVTYKSMLDGGIAKEVARMVLPVSIYSAQVATANPRSIMAFLSLRTKRPKFVATDEGHNDGAVYPSKPQREIEMVADKIEADFAAQFPITYDTFCANGRVAP